MIGLIFLFLQLFLAGFFLFLCLAFMTGGPFVPSKQSSVEAMIALAKIKKGDRVIDVGSGDGRVLFTAAAKGATAIGFEINPYLVWYTRIKAVMSGKSKTVQAYWKNLWTADLTHADVVFVYLIPWKMEDLQKKLERESGKGTLVISNSFMFPKWKLIRSDPAHHVFAYRL